MTTEREEAAPPWCPRLIAEFTAADERAIALAKTLTPEQLAWTARPGEWSICQCLEHLCLTSDVYLPAISKALVGRPPADVPEITPGWFGRWFIRNYIEASARTRKLRAPSASTPRAPVVDPAILDRFLSSNRQAREIVNGARHFDVNRIRFTNPFVPLIHFTVGTGFEILSKHQRRHLLQAERVKHAPGFPI